MSLVLLEKLESPLLGELWKLTPPPPSFLWRGGGGGGESSNNVGAVRFQKQVHDQNHITWLDKFYHATFHIWFSRAKIHDFTLWFWFKIISEAIIYTQQFFSAKTRVNKWVAMQHLAWISCFQLTHTFWPKMPTGEIFIHHFSFKWQGLF